MSLVSLTPAIQPDWFSRPSTEVAPDLLGCTLVRQLPNGAVMRSLIVETEAYAPGDPACHAYRRRTRRNAVMFGPAGFTYVYLIYGIYHCFNIVTDLDGLPSAVLVRAVQFAQLPPGIVLGQREKPDRVAAGPGKLCRALQIDQRLTEHPLQPGQPLWLEHRTPTWQQNFQRGAIAFVQTTRIGITEGADLPWRWYIQGNPAVSKLKQND